MAFISGDALIVNKNFTIENHIPYENYIIPASPLITKGHSLEYVNSTCICTVFKIQIRNSTGTLATPGTGRGEVDDSTVPP